MSVIQKGSYGCVIIDSKKLTVKKYINKFSMECDRFYEYYMEHSSIKECNILSTLKGINGISDAMYIKEHRRELCIKMEYGGLTIDKWVRVTQLEDRLKVLPYIFFQIINILFLFEKLEIVHGDIKPANILIKENNITIIDHGACILDTTILKVCKEPKAFNMCTYIFSSPEMLSLEKKRREIYTNHDIFSVALVIKYIITGKYIEDEYEKILNCKEKTYNISCIENTIDSEIYKLLCKMLTIDQKNRPFASELLKDKLFEKYSNNIYNKSIYKNKLIDTNSNSIYFVNTRNNYIDWLYDFCKSYNILHIMTLSVSIFDNFINIYRLEEWEYSLAFITSTIISDSLINCGYLSVDFMSKFYYKKDRLTSYIFFMLNKLEYKTYKRTFDYYIRKKNEVINYKIVKNILKLNIHLIHNQIKLYYKYLNKTK